MNATTKYYSSFRSYKIPHEPIDELAFADTKNLATYYIGNFDTDGRLVRFRKIIAERSELGVARLMRSGIPGSIVYVKCESLSEDRKIDNRNVINYNSTEDLQKYLRIEISSSGTEGQVILIHRVVFFDKMYS